VEAEKKGVKIDDALSNEGCWAAVCLGVLRRFTEKGDSRDARRYIVPQRGTSYADFLSEFSEFYLDPFYEYLDERLDNPKFILGQLIRFKHLCEWFRRDDLFKLWENNQQSGEKALAKKLYEFLFIEGVHIHIEPSSISGEADMVSSQEGEERLIADVKIFNPDKSKSARYIIQGFRQVWQYAADYNSAMGYLLIFNTSNKQLRFAVSGTADPIPHITLNHKTIFFLTIDLFPHETSASKRPQAEVVEVTEKDLLDVVQADVAIS
jgi:hypothetical protein